MLNDDLLAARCLLGARRGESTVEAMAWALYEAETTYLHNRSLRGGK